MLSGNKRGGLGGSILAKFGKVRLIRLKRVILNVIYAIILMIDIPRVFNLFG
jgi:hypothetical protein